MKRKIIALIVVTLIVIFGILAYKNTTNNTKKEAKNDGSLSIMVENDSGGYDKYLGTSWPTENYHFNETKSYCDGSSTLSWDTTTNRVNVVSTKSDKCYIYFDKGAASTGQAGTSSSEFISAKAGEKINLTVGGETYTGAIVSEQGIRYEGKNPNNYVRFNDELWRIIGVFDEETHGRSGEQLVKLIRNQALPYYYQWYNNKIYVLRDTLNTNYYNNNEITACSSYAMTNSCSNISVKDVGLKEENTRNLIQPIHWKFGGRFDHNVTAAEYYDTERGSAVGIDELPIGLIYPSDYGYAVQASDCERTTTLSDYYFSDTCHTENWLWNAGFTQWTISFYASSDYYIAYISNQGHINSDRYPNQTFTATPVLYLKQNVKITGGEGTKASPYTLSME